MNAVARLDFPHVVDATAAVSFTCPRCARTSRNPHDAANGYCGACHWWTGDAQLAPALDTAPGTAAGSS